MSSNKKHNFLVDFTNTMTSWDSEGSPFSTNTPQASPSRPNQDALRRDYGGLWYPGVGSRWRYGVAMGDGMSLTPSRPGARAPDALIHRYFYRDYAGISDVSLEDVVNEYTPEEEGSVPGGVPELSSRMRANVVVNSVGAEEFYGNEAPYGYIRQRIRIEANRDLLPAGGVVSTYTDVFDASTEERADPADITAWRNWCIENYYGRSTEEGSLGVYKTFLDHCASYDSPYTPLEKLASPNNRQAATTDFEYNFFIKKYENTIATSPTEDERIIPHIYTMYFEKSRGMGIDGAEDVPRGAPRIVDPSYNEDFLYSDFVTLNRALKKVFINSLRVERFDSLAGVELDSVRTEKTGEIDRVRYFEKWTSLYNRIYNPIAGSGYPPDVVVNGLNLIRSKYKNLLFTRNAAEESQGYNLYKNLFPMRCELSFPLAYSQFMGEAHVGDIAGFNLANASTVARIWDAYHGAQQRETLSQYLLKVNFAENHQSGDTIRATPDNIANGTERTAFKLADLFENLDSSRTGGANITFVDDFVSFRGALGVTRTEDPAGIVIDTNTEESPDDRIIDLNDGISYNEFINNMIELLQSQSEQYLRRYTEMLEGAESFSCPLYYRVNKYQRLAGQRGSLIQTIIIPQYTVIKNKLFSYIDTQMRYENSYEYEIIGYNAIIGSKYRFTELYLPTYTDSGAIIDGQVEYFGPIFLAAQTPANRRRTSMDRADGTRVALATAEPDADARIGTLPALATALDGVTEPALLEGSGNPFFAEIEVVVEPSIVVVEVPYIANGYPWMPSADTSFGIGTILDDPGISPNVRVIPYRGVDNKILFNLETGIGQEFNLPISISSREEQYYARLQENSDGENGPLVFYENDDPAAAFEIYRISSYPATYRDFENNMIANIPTDDRLVGYRRGASVSYVDDIRPNTKYYYMFRSLDIHGHYSYPSEIYEVEMIEDAGAVYPRVRVVDPLQDQSRKTLQKNLKRFLQIKPQLTQRLFNVGETFDPLDQEENASAPVTDNIVLGNRAEKIWDRKFKIRLTSKKSGKKIDLNVTFKKEYDDQRSDS